MKPTAAAARQTGMRTLLWLPVLVLAVACGGTPAPDPDPAADENLAGGGISRADNDLLVEIDRGDGDEAERYTLTCVGFVDGDHPDGEAACEHLKGMAEPFAPLDPDLMCTEIYGGPQTAHITGLWGGEPVDLRVARRNGCEIDQWESLGPLLPGPVGVDDPDAPQ